MSWDRFFKSQNYNQLIYKHKKLPIYMTKEFDFFRCVEFKDEFYGKTASELFNGNLRNCMGRFAKLFPGQKISYWANNPATARAEIKKHGAGCNILTFWAYDDNSSTFPSLENDEMLIIVDGRKTGIQVIIDKIEDGKDLTEEEQEIIDAILEVDIDAIAYDSRAYSGGENFIFLESGFKKLALRQLKLRFGRKDGGHHNSICCADTSDYCPFPKSYGQYFAPKCKVKMDLDYLKTEEYVKRKEKISKHRLYNLK